MSISVSDKINGRERQWLIAAGWLTLVGLGLLWYAAPYLVEPIFHFYHCNLADTQPAGLCEIVIALPDRRPSMSAIEELMSMIVCYVAIRLICDAHSVVALAKGAQEPTELRAAPVPLFTGILLVYYLCHVLVVVCLSLLIPSWVGSLTDFMGVAPVQEIGPAGEFTLMDLQVLVVLLALIMVIHLCNRYRRLLAKVTVAQDAVAG